MGEPVLIGIDCATVAARTGLARARIVGGRLAIDEVRCAPESGPADWIAEHVEEASIALLAVDAPLGWPAALAGALTGHMAGRGLNGMPNQLFRRTTDHFVEQTTGNRPLDVGADRIARTAWAALDVLERTAHRCRRTMTLAWSPATVSGLQAIEVYPGATLRALGLPDRGYKLPEQRPQRATIVDALATYLNWHCDKEDALDNADLLDAVLCLVTAQAFLQGRCHTPTEAGASPLLVRREGWIWVPRGDHSKPDVG